MKGVGGGWTEAGRDRGREGGKEGGGVILSTMPGGILQPQQVVLNPKPMYDRPLTPNLLGVRVRGSGLMHVKLLALSLSRSFSLSLSPALSLCLSLSVSISVCTETLYLVSSLHQATLPLPSDKGTTFNVCKDLRTESSSNQD